MQHKLTIHDFIAGTILFLGIVLVGSDGDYFPYANLIGLAMVWAVSQLVKDLV